MKQTLSFTIGAIFAVVGLLGCATPFRAPSDVAHIKLERVDSPIVIVEKIWLERKHSPLVVKGYVIKRTNAGDDTTQTHLDVTCYDASGNALRSTVDHFDPRQIPGHYPPQPPARRHRMAYSSYSVVLDPLPAGTARIQVRAHEGEHPSAP